MNESKSSHKGAMYMAIVDANPKQTSEIDNDKLSALLALLDALNAYAEDTPPPARRGMWRAVCTALARANRLVGSGGAK